MIIKKMDLQHMNINMDQYDIKKCIIANKYNFYTFKF